MKPHLDGRKNIKIEKVPLYFFLRIIAIEQVNRPLITRIHTELRKRQEVFAYTSIREAWGFNFYHCEVVSHVARAVNEQIRCCGSNPVSTHNLVALLVDFA